MGKKFRISAKFITCVEHSRYAKICVSSQHGEQLLSLVSNYQLNAQFLYSITIYMLHYIPRHVSSSTMLSRRTVRPFTESDYTRCCNNTICPPEDEHSTARNMSRIIL